MGKVESSPDLYQFSNHYLPWHAHITALTVAPEARRLGIGKILTEQFEAAANANDACIFRVVKDYYGDHATDAQRRSEDAFDMRKSMERDVRCQHVRDDGEMHEVEPEDVW
ncbi:hypothetical protein CDD82_243 [Ophiocordyceps australis]|uniref:N-acetyltransferase domain-containing protein n=1 Tax=Ophiocordyceps australis TaxID=1399860 RepID=A0A2C5YM99_9HYPO|nr:hypothetical protein CDD82_243 [Ophiocordyceps australis]